MSHKQTKQILTLTLTYTLSHSHLLTMSLYRTISEQSRRKAAVRLFNAMAKPFFPGKQWMKPKKVSWNKIGVTAVKYFDYTEGCLARKNGSQSQLKGPPASSIKEADSKEAMPFFIPKPETAYMIAKKKITKEKLRKNNYPEIYVDEPKIHPKSLNPNPLDSYEPNPTDLITVIIRFCSIDMYV